MIFQECGCEKKMKVIGMAGKFILRLYSCHGRADFNSIYINNCINCFCSSITNRNQRVANLARYCASYQNETRKVSVVGQPVDNFTE